MASLQLLEKRRPQPWEDDEVALLKALGVDPAEGLDPEQVEERLRRHGRNVLRERKKTSSWVRFLRQFKSPVVLTLIAATAVSALLGEFVDAAAIAFIVALNAVIGFLQESKAEAAVEALKRLSSPRARVLRAGSVVELAA
jgi:magnesium-transporting ATPase (P-type)